MVKRSNAALLGISALFALGCVEDPEHLSAAAQKGRLVYMANCLACHNADPRKIGALGPEIAGASRELVEARVLRATYPPGYTPKRQSRQMVPLPHLEDKIDELMAYLNESAAESS